MILPLPRTRVAPLPRTVAPLHREGRDSYIERLAQANLLTTADMREHLTRSRLVRTEHPDLPHALAQASRQPLARLLRALPDLATRDLIGLVPSACRLRLGEGWTLRPACALCTATRTVRYARCWAPPGTTSCLRHERWTGAYGQQFDTRALPEIASAQRRHHRLVRRFGWRRTETAITEASIICWGSWETGAWRENIDRRRCLLPAPAWSGTEQSLTLAACGYPEVVALAGVLVDPSTRALPLDGTGRMPGSFDAIRSRIVSDCEPGQTAASLIRWIEEEGRQPSSMHPETPQ